MEMIRWGIIGCGNVTEVKSGPAFNLVPNSKLLAVMRRDQQLLHDYAVRHNVPLTFTNASELIQHPEIDAIYITDNDTNIPNEIKLVNYIGCSDFDLESYKRFDTTSDLCKWAVGSVTTLNSNDWYKPAFKWIADNLKYTWALDIEGQLYFLNKGYDFFIFPKKIKEVVKVSDHENLEKAVKHLFKKVVECEFR